MADATTTESPAPGQEVSRFRALPGPLALVPAAAAFLVIAASVNHFFILNFDYGLRLDATVFGVHILVDLPATTLNGIGFQFLGIGILLWGLAALGAALCFWNRVVGGLLITWVLMLAVPIVTGLIGTTLLDNQYLFLIVALLVPLVFLYWPVSPGLWRNAGPTSHWIQGSLDGLLALILVGICIYFIINGNRVVDDGWEYEAPPLPTLMSGILWLLVLEATRRAGGWPIFFICLVISLYPLFAGSVPEPFKGKTHGLEETARYHAMSTESIFGIPMRAFANVVIGFLILGAALAHSGAGKFFINLAFALLGTVRGGPAKVAIFSSGMMGSMSGSVISNVMTTGVLSIPAMRRIGLSRAHAGGVEACASTGGVLMPPIMGATAFIMATFLKVDYVDVAIAAIVPSVLYFFGLFVQIDAYAARHKLSGLPRAELPSLKQTVKEGWYYLFVLALLVWMLIFLKRETIAPFYATALLIGIDVALRIRRKEDVGWGYFRRFLEANAKLLAELAGILGGVGLIVGAMAFTGLSGTIANSLVQLAGGSVLVLLLMGAAVSFVLGIGMTVTAAYIFLAIALAPALEKGGLDVMAVHMFIFYWGMLSYITPPVALGAFAAATVAGARPMRTGFEAMKLGTIIYFVPFFFVLDPALILKGAPLDVIYIVGKALIGTWLVAAALQGHLVFVGDLALRSALSLPIRLLLAVGGILIVLPGSEHIPWPDEVINLTGLAMVAVAVGMTLLLNRGADPTTVSPRA